MQFSVSINNRGATYLDQYSAPDMLKLAQLTDDLGFDQLWVHDNILGNSGYEAISTLSAIAAVTKRIKIGTSILIPYYRNIILLSEQLSTIDQISSGRLIVGFGTGGVVKDTLKERKELFSRGVDHNGVIDEMLSAMQRLWESSPKPADFNGRFFSYNNIVINYRPVQRPSPPIWIASGTFHKGRYYGKFELVSKRADGWFTLRPTPEEYERALSKIMELRKSYSNTKPLTRCVEFWFTIDSNPERAHATCKKAISSYVGKEIDDETASRWSLMGSPDRIIERIQKFQDAGMDAVKIISARGDQNNSIKSFARQIIPSFSKN